MPLQSRPRSAEPADVGPPSTSRVGSWALVASLAAAGGIHLAVGYEHDFGGAHGTFFLVAGVIQAVGAAVVARRPDRRLIGLAAAGSAALLATWVAQRTPGLPGGDALDPLATATAAAEVLTIVAAVRLLARPVAHGGRIPGIAALALVAFVAVGSGGFADDGHDDHHHAEETVVSDATPQASSSEPKPLRPLPVAPADDHDGDSTVDGVSSVEAVPVPPTEHAPGPPPGDDHHDDAGAAPHGH